MVSTPNPNPNRPPGPPGASRFYALAWRWHFYAGLYVVPFLVMLALTGLVMVFFTGFQNRLGMTTYVVPQGQALAVSAQARPVLAQFPTAQLKEYIAPKTPEVPSWFLMVHDGVTDAVAVNPYTAEILKVVNKDSTVFAWAEKIHGKLLLGDIGSYFVEVAAGLGIVMIVTGLYLFWPRQQSRWSEVLVPDWQAQGRKWWKSLHASLGFWLSVVLFLFLLTGMSWTGVWGAKLVQPWSTFPASKWDAVPTSDATHASLNSGGLHDVPWGLEQTPLPVSGSSAGTPGIHAGEAVNLDGVAALAQRLGFAGQYHINVPQDATGVYSISADTMSGDLHNPFHDRFVHVDRYTGRILAQVGYADYAPVAKAMAVGIALHQGDVGLWSACANVLFCLAVITLCASGIVMWWMRRPQGSGRLAAPSVPAQAPLWKGGAVVMLLTALAFPLAGGVLLAVLLLDWLLISRVSALKTVLS
ncbi:MAG: PepSY domain-containing protein [Rhodoferax sp.]|uniref:PepSY-associated TM helix domain-containing protein n=1 Tax=Rhodoferax sp. TaxID=50421 RepID=UPI0032632C37